MFFSCELSSTLQIFAFHVPSADGSDSGTAGSGTARTRSTTGLTKPNDDETRTQTLRSPKGHHDDDEDDGEEQVEVDDSHLAQSREADTRNIPSDTKETELSHTHGNSSSPSSSS